MSYHKHEPRNQEEARSDYAMHSIQLKNTFTVGPSSSKITPCVKVSSPETKIYISVLLFLTVLLFLKLDTGTDKLWFRCKSKRKEQQWINAIREGCQRYATRMSKYVLTSIIQFILET